MCQFGVLFTVTTVFVEVHCVVVLLDVRTVLSLL